MRGLEGGSEFGEVVFVVDECAIGGPMAFAVDENRRALVVPGFRGPLGAVLGQMQARVVAVADAEQKHLAAETIQGPDR